MKYNPVKPLSQEELYQLSEAEMFEYLDSKAEYLSQFAEPLGVYETKRYAAMSKGSMLTDEELESAKRKGRVGENYRADRIMEAAKGKRKPNMKTKTKPKGHRGWID